MDNLQDNITLDSIFSFGSDCYLDYVTTSDVQFQETDCPSPDQEEVIITECVATNSDFCTDLINLEDITASIICA